jgi:hypothetical protein
MPTEIPINTIITIHMQAHITKLVQAHIPQGVVFLNKNSLLKIETKFKKLRLYHFFFLANLSVPLSFVLVVTL